MSSTVSSTVVSSILPFHRLVYTVPFRLTTLLKDSRGDVA